MPGKKGRKKGGKKGAATQDEEYYQILLLGIGGVGKSSLVLRLVFSEFHEEYNPSEVDSYQAHIEADGLRAKVDILDTSGQEDYAAARDTYIRSCVGFLVVFSVTEQESFDSADELVESIRRIKFNEAAPIFIVGNKCDLQERRKVWSSTGSDYAQSQNLQYFETSAKTGENVEQLYVALVRHMRAARQAADEQGHATEQGHRRRRRCVLL